MTVHFPKIIGPIMPHKSHMRISIDIPIDTYLKIQDVHKKYAMNIEESIIELIQHGLLTYPECPLDHTPNAITKKAIANIEAKKHCAQRKKNEEK